MVAEHPREGLTRLPLIVVVAAFCLPLFFGLGRTDLENDESIYSYAIESILTTGDWLSPRSSPHHDVVFLEKPPLKFWIVGVPIRLGLLPHNEFGLRFWDALFGGIAFIYVFLLGRRLAGWISGAVAVLLLFVHEPLLFDHGLRSNNMEAALFLSYCGGIYHYLEWAAGRGRRGRHLAALAALFYLGFMTKFVAAMFLPMVIVATALAVPAHRAALLTHWRGWLLASAVVLAAILPWFVYQWGLRGEVLLEVMFGEHVYTRFTRYTDPGHVAPWHFYVSEAWLQFTRSGAALWVAFGLIVLAVQTVRDRTPERLIVLIWLIVPVSLISLGTSKLYHYFYPYLPPLALAAGFGVAWLVTRAADFLRHRIPAPAAPSSFRRRLFLVLMLGALAVALLTAIEPMQLEVGGRTVFRNHSVFRPLAAAALFAAIAGRGVAVACGIGLLAASLVIPSPVEAYASSLERLAQRRAPLRALRECLGKVDATKRGQGEPASGPYTPVHDAFLHSYFYYFRGSGWLERPDRAALLAALFTPGEERPVVMGPGDYHRFLASEDLPGEPPLGISRPEIVFLLPGDYADCRFTPGVWLH